MTSAELRGLIKTGENGEVDRKEECVMLEKRGEKSL